MKKVAGVLLMLCMGLGFPAVPSARATAVYVTADYGYETALRTALAGWGYTLNPSGSAKTIDQLTGSDLSGYDVLIMKSTREHPGWSYDENEPTHKSVAALAVEDFLNNGGGVLASGWTVYSNAEKGDPADFFPATGVDYGYGKVAVDYGGGFHLRFVQATADSTLNDQLASDFEADITGYGYSGSFFTAQPGATVYYRTPNLTPAYYLNDFYEENNRDVVIGWDFNGAAAGGRVLSYASLLDQKELDDPDFNQLVYNMVRWVDPIPEPNVLALVLFCAAGLIRYGRRVL